MRRANNRELWKSFADLAMGLMAVFVLVLVVLLWQQERLTTTLAEEQDRTKESLRTVTEEKAQIVREKEAVVAERERLEKERAAFALELMRLFESTYGLVQTQDRAEQWLSQLFEEGPCQLRMTERGELVIATAGSTVAAASLYDSGRFAMSVEGRAALESCKANFLKLAYCLAPADDVPAPALARRAAFCEEGEPGPERTPVDELRIGVEALTLEGNTDRIALGGGTPSIRTMGGGLPFQSDAGASFVENAYLGAERARQALGNLISLVEGENADEWDALQIMMSRLRIESPSYGRFQAGPSTWREPGCGDAAGCAAARNLSLRIRWKKSALREPFELVRQRICALLGDPASAFAKGLVSQGRPLAAERERFRCSELVAP